MIASRHNKTGLFCLPSSTLVSVFGGALAVTVFLGACLRLGPPDDAAPLIRRPTWYNFYTRGLWFSRKEQWPEAIADLEVALGRRPGAQFGNDSEKRRARTYGLHFLDDYFPHRELGICLFHLNELDAAEKEISLSLEQLESARAKYYLNEVRRARLPATATALPARPVRFDVEIQTGPYLTNRTILPLAGKLVSPYRIDRVSINRRPLFIELAEVEFAFRESVRLHLGENQITIQARDLAGRTYSWQKKVTVDIEGPAVSVTASPSGSSGNGLVAIVKVNDNLGLASVKINGKPQLSPDRRTSTKKTFHVPMKAGAVIRIEALDRAGNRTRIEVPTKDLRSAAAESRHFSRGRRLAWAVPARGGGRRGIFTTSGRTFVRPASALMSQPGAIPAGHPSRIAADFTLASAALVVSGKTSKDTLPPRLKLFPDVQNEIRVTTRFYVLDIQAEDNGCLDRVAVAIEPGGREERSFRQDRSTICRFTHTLELDRGANVVRIEAMDLAGNRKTRRFTITRIEDPLWREELRITLQVLPPRRQGGEVLRKTDLYSMLLEALLEEPRRFNIVERDPEVVQRMLLELKLGESSLVDYKRAVKTGKMKPADWLLLGHVSAWSGKENCDLFGKLVDVATGREILTADIHFVGEDRAYIKSQLDGFTEKLRQQLPALSARVANAKSKRARLTVGQRDSIRPGLRFLFISAGEDDPDFADPIEWKGRWIEGRVVRTRDRQCLVKMFPPDGASRVQAGDLAILR